MATAPILQHSPEWHEARKCGIGGSNAPAVFNLSDFKSQFELYAEMIGEAPPKPETEAMRWGKVLEPAIREECSRRREIEIAPAPAMFTSESHPFMLASLDGEIVKDPRGPGIYEGKNFSAFRGLKSGEIPEDVWVQVQHNMHVRGASWAIVAILIGGSSFYSLEIERDSEAIEMLIDGEREFMRRVELRDPPPADGMASTGALLRRMYPSGNGRTIFMDDPAAKLRAMEIDVLKEKVSELEKDMEARKQDFQKILGKNERAIIPGYGKVSWITVRPEDVLACDFDRFSLEEPEVFARFVSTQPKRTYRRFMTHPLKKEDEETDEPS